MQETPSHKPQLIHPLECYLAYLTTIHDVPLTHREVDVLSCLLNRPHIKGIANFLSISPKTVAAHLLNATRKFGCSSDIVISIIEHSEQFLYLKQHYHALLINNLFKTILQGIAQQTKDDIHSQRVTLVYWQKKPYFLEEVESDLRICGLLVSLECRKDPPAMKSLLEQNNSREFQIYFVPDTLFCAEDIQSNDQQTISYSQNKIIFLFETTQPSLLDHQEFPFFIINPSSWRSYYYSTFEIFKRIRPDVDFEEWKTQFEEKSDILLASPSVPSSFDGVLEDQSPKYFFMQSFFKKLLSQRLKYKYLLLGTVSATALILLIGTQSFVTFFPNHALYHSKSHPIRSDLFVPSAATFLNRPDLILQIERQFSQQRREPIQTVALVGVGGAGKTTLAHHYASSQQLPVVWEIHAETRESLNRSFVGLAQTLSKTEADQKEFKKLRDIKNLEERMENLKTFVKERLRSLSPWLLIYDNVDEFSEIQDFFPQDFQTWGQGKVLITTCDQTLQQNNAINNCVEVRELTPKQKFILFSKIINRQARSCSSQQNQEAKTFLDKLPSYPLDISLAAHYLKAANISYATYLLNIEENSKEFVNTQINLMNDMSHYNKSRYRIISLSLQRLLKAHKDFGELLLLITLVNSQNIPRQLLEINKSRFVVDNLIVYLKKYSLMTSDTSSPTNPNLSIHRSTQKIGLDYLIRSLDIKKNTQLIQTITKTLEKYGERVAEGKNYAKLKSLATHYEALVRHKDIFNNRMRASACGELGILYFYLCQYKQAKPLLEESFTLYQKYPLDTSNSMARVLSYLGNVYRKLGDYKHSKEVLEQSLRIYWRYLPTNYQDIAKTLTYLSLTFRDQGDLKLAKEFLERSLSIYKRYIPHNHEGLCEALLYLGTVYKYLGQYEKSRDTFEKAFTVHQQAFPENEIDRSRILAHLGNIHRKLGNYQQAKESLGRSLAIYKNEYGDNHIHIAWVSAYLGNVYDQLGNYDKAKILLETSYTTFKENYSQDHVDTSWASGLLARVYSKIGKLEIAEDLAEKNLAINKKTFPSNHVAVAWAAAILGNIYCKQGQHDKAKQLFETSLATYENHYGKNHSETTRLIKDMAQIAPM